LAPPDYINGLGLFSIQFLHPTLFFFQLPTCQPARYLLSVACVCYNVVMFVMTIITMSVITAIEHKRSQQRYKTFTTDRQWYWDNAIKFVKWQHPATGCRATFALSATNCLVLSLIHLHLAVKHTYVRNTHNISRLSWPSELNYTQYTHPYHIT